MEEITQIHEFMAKVGENVTVIWGASFDDELGDEVKMTLIATGFDVKDIPGMPSGLIKKRKTVEEKKENAIEVVEEPVSEEELEFNKKSSEEEFNKAMGELYGPSLRQIKTEKKEEVIQEILQFEAAPEDKLPVVNIFELESEEDLNQVEQVPAWKRRFMKK